MRFVKYLILCGFVVSPLAFADGMDEYREGVAKEALSKPAVGPGLERASAEQLETATGHYARTRALLLAAINEFDKGLKVANPDAIIDSNEWRATLIDRAHELEKILDPQPRATKGGVKYSADTRLLNEAKR